MELIQNFNYPFHSIWQRIKIPGLDPPPIVDLVLCKTYFPKKRYW